MLGRTSDAASNINVESEEVMATRARERSPSERGDDREEGEGAFAKGARE